MGSAIESLKAEGVPTLDRVSALNRLDGDEELYLELLTLYLEDAPTQIAAIARSSSEGNAELAERSAHSLKSASAHVGAEIVRRIAYELELLGRKGDFLNVAAILPELKSAFNEFETVVNTAGLLARS